MFKLIRLKLVSITCFPNVRVLLRRLLDGSHTALWIPKQDHVNVYFPFALILI